MAHFCTVGMLFSGQTRHGNGPLPDKSRVEYEMPSTFAFHFTLDERLQRTDSCLTALSIPQKPLECEHSQL